MGVGNTAIISSVPAHGPLACSEDCPAKDKKYRPQDYHDSKICSNKYFFFPQINISMKIYDWICIVTTKNNATQYRAEVLVGNPVFDPKPIGAPNTPNETHPYTMEVQISLIQKNIVPTKTTSTQMEFLTPLGIKKGKDSELPDVGKILGTGKPVKILNKLSQPANWDKSIDDGWGPSVPGYGDHKVTHPTIDAPTRKDVVLLASKFLPTHLRIEFKSSCPSCNRESGGGWGPIHDHPLVEPYSFIPEPETTFLVLKADPPSGGKPTFDHDDPETKPKTIGVGSTSFKKSTVNITNIKDGVNTGWSVIGWDVDALGPETKSVDPPNDFVLKDTATITCKYKKDDIDIGAGDGDGMFDSNLDTVYPHTYDKSKLENIGIGWVDHPSYPEQKLHVYKCMHSKEVITGVDEDGNSIEETIEWEEEHIVDPPTITLISPLPWESAKKKDPPGHTSSNGLCSPTNGTMPRAGYIFHGWQTEKLGGSEITTGMDVIVGTGGGCDTEDGPGGGGPVNLAPPTFWARWERVVNIWVCKGGSTWHLSSVTRINQGGWKRNVELLKRNDGGWIDPFGKFKNF